MNNSDNRATWQLLRGMWQHINSRRRAQLGFLLSLMTLTSFAEVVSIGAVLPFLGVLTAPEQVFRHQLVQPLVKVFGFVEAEQLLLPCTILFIVAALLSGLIRLITLWTQIRLSYALGADLSINIYRRTLYQPYAVHVARSSSEVIAGISTKANIVVSYTIMPILTIIGSIMILFAILVALLSINPVVAMSAITGFGAVYLLIILIARRRLANCSHVVASKSNDVIKVLQEGLGGIRDVLLDGTQETFCKIYQNADIPLRRAQANIQIISSSPRYGIEALGMVLVAILAYLLVLRLDGFANAIPLLGALALGAQRLLPVLQQIYASWTSLQAGQDTLRDALTLLGQLQPEHADVKPPAQLPFQYSITLNEVGFRYSNQSPWVLRGANISIPKGSRIGFIGSTGSGKTTLLDIIMGLQKATEGALLIDGLPITLQNLRAWQAHIAHVPQSIFLSDSTIMENIAFGVPHHEIDYERVRQSAQKAQIAETIESWESKYNTNVGERGVRLSGGQRQRIGIARALYKQADVIIFDEATSALDNETEQAVMQAIESLSHDLTLLIIAHRLTTLNNCTYIVELGEGGIKRSGSYLEIVNQSLEHHESLDK